jgi:cysteine desulfurase
VLVAIGVDPAVAQTAVRFTLPRSLDTSLAPVARAVAEAVATVGSGG